VKEDGGGDGEMEVEEPRAPFEAGKHAATWCLNADHARLDEVELLLLVDDFCVNQARPDERLKAADGPCSFDAIECFRLPCVRSLYESFAQ
jgi:hypothetical protein